MNYSLYAERDIEKQGTHYVNHVMAMTKEGLHSKSAIAAELAHRDIALATMTAERDEANAHAARLQNQLAELQADKSDALIKAVEELVAIAAERDALNTAENRRAIGLGFSKSADEEILRLHNAFDDIAGRLSIVTAERDALLAELQQGADGYNAGKYES